jgi:hypothetical protein
VQHSIPLIASRLTIAIDSALQLEEKQQQQDQKQQLGQQLGQQQKQQQGQELEQEQEQLSIADSDLQEIYKEFLFQYEVN